tara:strand:+ start:3657 stop:4769 length:1113 start_codon:yes stop_codon:yes gene_type:complete
MEINKIRESIALHNGLQNIDDIYTFYYDETNNIRKLYLSDFGLNVEQEDNFVLAGIVHKGTHHNSDFASLFDTLKLQKTAKELKLKHVAKGSFIDMLKSRKLNQILDWLSVNGFYIHYFNLNIVYWSVIDIIDSIISEAENSTFIINHLQLKGDFYEVITSTKVDFLRELNHFNYPDVKQDKFHAFCNWMISLVRTHSDMLANHRANMLQNLFEEALTLDDLPFISGGHGKELIDNFLIFYLQKLYIFKNSWHIFDEEEQIQNLIEGISWTDNGNPLKNYEFVKSHDNSAVQISDVIAGFLGKYFTYLKNVNSNQLRVDVASLDEQQVNTFVALKRLIDHSDTLSRGLFTVVNSENERIKHDLFYKSCCL